MDKKATKLHNKGKKKLPQKNKLLLNLEARDADVTVNIFTDHFPGNTSCGIQERRLMDRTNELVSSYIRFFFPLPSQSAAHSLYNLSSGEGISSEKLEVLSDYHIYPIIQITVILMEHW